MIHYDSIDFDGDITIIPREVLEVMFDCYLIGNNLIGFENNYPYEMLMSDTLICCEDDFIVYDNDNEPIGKICDWTGCCELVTMHTKDLLAIFNNKFKTTSELLDAYYTGSDNDNIGRCEIDANGEYSQIFELKNCKGTVTNSQKVIAEDYESLVMYIEGIDKSNGKPINIRISDYADEL